jgi:hypothetical protein
MEYNTLIDIVVIGIATLIAFPKTIIASVTIACKFTGVVLVIVADTVRDAVEKI